MTDHDWIMINIDWLIRYDQSGQILFLPWWDVPTKHYTIRRVGCREFPRISIRGPLIRNCSAKNVCIWQLCIAHMTSAQCAVIAVRNPPIHIFSYRLSRCGEGPLATAVSRSCTCSSLYPMSSSSLLGLRCCMSSLLGLIIPIVEDGQHYRFVSTVPVAVVGHLTRGGRLHAWSDASTIIATIRISAVPSYLSNRMVLGYHGPPAGVAVYNL